MLGLTIVRGVRGGGEGEERGRRTLKEKWEFVYFVRTKQSNSITFVFCGCGAFLTREIRASVVSDLQQVRQREK